MGEWFAIILATVLVNNFVLVQFLGLCPFMGVTKRLEGTIGMCFATVFVLTLASGLSWIVNRLLLVPFELGYLRIIAFIMVIAAVVQFTEMLVRSIAPMLHRVLGIFLPLITTNCAVLGVALLNTQKQHGLFESLLYGFGAAMGFSLVLVALASQRERLEIADIPTPFRGAAIGLISAGIMALAFIGFAGLVRS
ncbi:MAG: electron transport complex subunit RsxA [Gammaproteobacteria bacterium]|nr:electron transport complex subunit RsxA [Gammaproteobacteria bacterium]